MPVKCRYTFFWSLTFSTGDLFFILIKGYHSTSDSGVQDHSEQVIHYWRLLCYRKYRQGVNAACVCVESLPTLNGSLFILSIRPFGELGGPII